MNKLKVLTAIFVLMFTGIGCWDVRDVTNRAFVTAIGLDAAEEGFKVTLLIPRPANIKNISSQIYSVHETEEAESISKAVSLLQSKLSRDISFGHLRAVVIGEKLARQSNFNDLLSYIGKNPEVAFRHRLFFVEGREARDVLATIPFLNRALTSELVGLAGSGEHLGVVRTKRFFDFLGDLRQTNGNALGARMVMKNNNGRAELSRIGGAIFTNWRLAGWLNPDEMRDANWLLKENPNIVVVTKLGKGQYSCLINKKSVKIKPLVDDNGQLKFAVNIKAVGNISEQLGTSLDLTEPQNMQKVEAAIKKTVYQQASKAVQKSQQEVGSDYLGFDRALINNEPELYANRNWPEVYPTIPVEIKVELRIPTVGIERR
ncbi:MAG: Ger(x)C family spore germination protein [Thermincola sp.]|jgi:spore germination protein KC|nr:Ger(x)C family spore germination protein [Thermincola sp.]MDT3704681.1 Ger(x)C family spore germination protein [Thermincola sp.]